MRESGHDRADRERVRSGSTCKHRAAVAMWWRVMVTSDALALPPASPASPCCTRFSAPMTTADALAGVVPGKPLSLWCSAAAADCSSIFSSSAPPPPLPVPLLLPPPLLPPLLALVGAARLACQRWYATTARYKRSSVCVATLAA